MGNPVAKSFSVTVDIQAPPAAVWEVLQDVERWPTWTPTMTSVRRLDSGPLAVGSRARIRQPGLPPSTWVVTDLDAGRGFSWISTAPLMRTAAEHWVEPHPGGSRVLLVVHFSGPLSGLAARFAGKLTQDYIVKESQGLKRRVEGGDG